jgi:hypothetical protein
MRLDRHITTVFALAGGLLAAQEKPKADAPPFQSAIDVFGKGGAVLSPIFASKLPLTADGQSLTYTFVEGKFEDSPEEGKKFQTKYLDQTFVLEFHNNEGGTTILQRLGDLIVLSVDTKTDSHSVKDFENSTLFIEAVDQRTQKLLLAGRCGWKEQIVFKIENGNTVRYPAWGYGGCKPLDPSELVPVQEILEYEDPVQELCATRPVGYSDHYGRHKTFYDDMGKPLPFSTRPEAIAAYIGKTREFFGEQINHFSNLVKFFRDKFHKDLSNDFSDAQQAFEKSLQPVTPLAPSPQPVADKQPQP